MVLTCGNAAYNLLCLTTLPTPYLKHTTGMPELKFIIIHLLIYVNSVYLGGKLPVLSHNAQVLSLLADRLTVL